jgi:CRAL/TRIO domain
MLIINAPSFFSMAWGIIKKFIDPQTAKRIRLLSGKEAGLKALKELVDIDEIPKDYGGNNKTFEQAFMEEANDPFLIRSDVELVHVKRKGKAITTKQFTVNKGEYLVLKCYTRSVSTATVSAVVNGEVLVSCQVECKGYDGEASCHTVAEKIEGPATATVEVHDLDDADKKHAKMSRGYFLIVCDTRKPGGQEIKEQKVERRRSLKLELASTELGMVSKEPVNYDQLDHSERFKKITNCPVSEMMKRLTEPRICLESPGYPGCLSQAQLDECEKFLRECPESIYDQIWSLRDVLEPEYIICRWVRATKWDAAAIIARCQDNQPLFDEAMKHQFYPDIDKALGAPFAVFMTQYPMLPIGKGKNGCTVNYFRAGQINPEGVMAMTTLAKMEHYFWWGYMHQLKADLRQKISDDPDFVRCEGINVIDLQGLSRAALSSETMDCIKLSSKIGDYFPEVSVYALLLKNLVYFFCGILSDLVCSCCYHVASCSPSTKC